LTVPSLLAVASWLPSGLYATLLTWNVWRVRLAVSVRLSTSHNWTNSSLPVASCLPSGL
jgi:hypothetical protein